MLRRDVVDELLDQHGLADAGTAEEADLAALRVRGEQVDDLDAGLEQGRLGIEILELRRLAVNAPALAGDGLAVVDRVAEHVEDAAERLRTDRDADRGAGVDDLGATGEAVRGVHGDRADAVIAEMLLDLSDDEAAVGLDVECRVDRGKRVREYGVDDDALDLHDLADVALAHVRPVPSQVDGLEGGAARARLSARASGGTLANVAAGRRDNRALRAVPQKVHRKVELLGGAPDVVAQPLGDERHVAAQTQRCPRHEVARGVGRQLRVLRSAIGPRR